MSKFAGRLLWSNLVVIKGCSTAAVRGNFNLSTLSRVSRRFCIDSSAGEGNKILFHFSNGFFKFRVRDNNFMVSYWTPLQSLVEVIDGGTSDATESSSAAVSDKIIDDQNEIALSRTTPIGFVLANIKSISFQTPTLGQCHVQLAGQISDLVDWKEEFELKLQYGSDGKRKAETLEEQEINFLEQEQTSLRQTFYPMLRDYQKIVKQASVDANRKFKWGGLFLLSAQLGFVARLTWFEYSWDIMEPVTWMLTYAMMVGTFAYYIVTSQEYLVPSVERRLTINKFWKIAQKQKFDVEKFRKLREQLRSLDAKITRLRLLG